MNSLCIVCGKDFPQRGKYQRMTCSEKCRFALVAKKNRRGKPPKKVKPPKIEPQRKPPPEPGDKWARSSFTEVELGICRSILTCLNERPKCKCANSEQKVRIESMVSGFKAFCEWCGFVAFSSGSSWPGVETVKVERRRAVMD